MGQKVNPHGLRVGVVKGWDTIWFANKKDFANLLVEDSKIRGYIQTNCKDAAVSKVVIERTQPEQGKVVINVHCARPGVIIGQKGAGIETLKKALKKIVGGKEIVLNIKEIKNPDGDANVVAQSIAQQIEKRVLVKKAIKSSIPKIMKSGAKGCKIMVKGRVNGVEIARSEKFAQGSVPLHTLRADIDYGFAEAHTTYGALGVKVWIYKGEVLEKKKSQTFHKQGGEQ